MIAFKNQFVAGLFILAIVWIVMLIKKLLNFLFP